ncbi:SdpI family protein [Patescibacteria group bacterium]|nr:SdpI family protein [Patescibacteria group bacterium]
MRKINKIMIAEFSLLLIVLLITIFLWNDLPDRIPMHWNINGEVDKYSNKLNGLLGLFSIPLLFSILYPIFRKIDPKNKKYEQFEKTWKILNITIFSFFIYLYLITIFLTLNPQYSIEPFILGGIGTMFIIMGNYMSKIKQNYFIGVKTPWAIENEDNWNKTHRLAGICFIISGLLFIIEIFLSVSPIYILIPVIVACAIIPILYSYILYKKNKKK